MTERNKIINIILLETFFNTEEEGVYLSKNIKKVNKSMY